MTYGQRWISQPRTAWLRNAIFQLHLWSGIGIGLYVLLASVTGSVLVFSNELYRAATSDPITVTEQGARLNDEQLRGAATRAYPGYTVLTTNQGRKPNQAVHISLRRGSDLKHRLFDPYSGADLGDAVPLGIWLVSKLVDLHDNLLAGRTGRTVNGAGALLLVVLALTGMVVWWPGVKAWRRSLTVRRHAGWQRFTWDLHSAMGFWSVGFILLFGVSGAYLGNPGLFQNAADWIEPPTDANAGVRTVDRVIYWLAFLHFGRINGIGIPCNGPGLCDSTTKSLWAVLGLAPAAMFVTGAMVWWNRVVRSRLGLSSRHSLARTKTMRTP